MPTPQIRILDDQALARAGRMVAVHSVTAIWLANAKSVGKSACVFCVSEQRTHKNAGKIAVFVTEWTATGARGVRAAVGARRGADADVGSGDPERTAAAANLVHGDVENSALPTPRMPAWRARSAVLVRALAGRDRRGRSAATPGPSQPAGDRTEDEQVGEETSASPPSPAANSPISAILYDQLLNGIAAKRSSTYAAPATAPASSNRSREPST